MSVWWDEWGVVSEAFWKTKLLPEATLGVTEVMEERRRSVDVLWRKNDPHCRGEGVRMRMEVSSEDDLLCC